MKDLEKIFRHARFRQAPGIDAVVATPTVSTPAATTSSSTKKTVSTTPATTPAATTATKNAYSGYSGYSGGGSSGYSYDTGGGEVQEQPDPAAVAAQIAAQMNAISKDAYKKNKKTIKNIYNTALNSYDTTKGLYDTNLENNNDQLEAQARYSRQLATADAEQAMREAYINQMLSRRDMAQWLSSQGLTGGASETARASLENAYQNARAQIDAGRNRSVSDLNMTYNTNIAEAIRQYNEMLAQLEAQKAQIDAQNAQLKIQNENRYAGNQLSALQTGLSYAMKK